ncbi:MAG TPA: amidohydrolase family protein [Acidimicrobiales bacterium]|nr:amidohydrolase family protein [Acidimicrobiales bacterium]
MARTVFTNANLLDGEHPAKPDTTVVVDGARITAVTTGAVETRADDRVINLAGRSLMPGMVSGHFHTTYHNVGGTQLPFGLETAPAYQAYRALVNAQIALHAGFTSVCGASAAFDIDASLDAAIRDGLVQGPRMVPASRDLITTGDSNDVMPWWYDANALGVVRTADGPDEFRKVVRDEIKRGAKMIKLYVTGGHGVLSPKSNVSITLPELHAVVDAAHGRGARVRGHVATKQAILDCVAAGVDIIDHADGLDEECIDKLVEAGTIVLPSLYLPLKILELMGDAPGQNTLGFTTETGQDFEQMCAILPKAVEAGVKLCVGDDFGASFTPHGGYAAELAVYVEHAGIPPLEVLTWATRNGAELMGMANDIGSVSEGRLADLVVVDGDPSADIGVLADRIVAVVKDGDFALDRL